MTNWPPESLSISDYRPNECADFQCRIKVSSTLRCLFLANPSSVKTIIILTYGWVSEGRALTLKDSMGIILALGGASLYSQLSQK